MSSEIVLEFVKCINKHDVKKFSHLMTDDHTFTDAHSNTVVGKDNMIQGWQGYFSMFPDYAEHASHKIEIDEFYEAGNVFIMMGFASGTFKGMNPERNHWKLPAARKAVTDDGKVKWWQVIVKLRLPMKLSKKTHKIH